MAEKDGQMCCADSLPIFELTDLVFEQPDCLRGCLRERYCRPGWRRKVDDIGAHGRAPSATTDAADNWRTRASCANCANARRYSSASCRLSMKVVKQSFSSSPGSFTFISSRPAVTSSSLDFSITARASRRVMPRVRADSFHFDLPSD